MLFGFKPFGFAEEKKVLTQGKIAMAYAVTELPSTPLSTLTPGQENGARRDARLWSSLQEVCALLAMPFPAHLSGDLMFQHVQFKPGQAIHSVGQPFEMLYLVNSGFLKTTIFDELGN